MSLAFVYPFISRINSYNYHFNLNLILFAFLFLYSSNTHSQSLTAEQIYKKVSGAVVVIHAYNYNNELSTQGSGVVISDKGYVVTNYHVLSGNNRIEILHGKEIVPYVDIIGIDVEKDILILKIKDKKFPAIKIGKSNNLNIGQRVYTIGSPMGLENSISEGIISGLRNYDELRRNFIQISASISHGSSGGAVINDKGELIGISTLTLKEGQNLNFAIPIEDVLQVKIDSYSKNDTYKDFELFKHGYDAYEKGNYEESIKYFSLYIEKYPNDAEAYNNRGVAKHEFKYFLSALLDYDKAIEINPNIAEAYFNRGKTKYNLKNYQESIEDYSKAIEINPNYAEAYFNRGIAKGSLSDYNGAIEDYNKAIEINPNNDDAYFGCGLAKSFLSDYRGAIQDYDKAIEINPNIAEAYFNRGIAKDNLQDYQGAIFDYNKAAELNPKYAKINQELAQEKANNYLQSGKTKCNLKDYQGAIQDYNKAIEINPNYTLAYFNRAFAKVSLSDFRGSIQDYGKAIEINPNYADAYFSRGLVKAILGDKNGACLDWSKAGELGSADAYDNIRKFCK